MDTGLIDADTLASAQAFEQAIDDHKYHAARDERLAREKAERRMRLARVVIKSHRPKFTIPARSALPKNGAHKRGRR